MSCMCVILLCEYQGTDLSVSFEAFNSGPVSLFDLLFF